MEELESLLNDLKNSIAAKEDELLKNGKNTPITRSFLRYRYLEIKFFEFSLDSYRKLKMVGPDIVEKMKRDYSRIKSEIEMIS